MNEQQVSDVYRTITSEMWDEEVPVGGLTIDEITDNRSSYGQFAKLRIDLYAPSDTVIKIAEVKQELSITAIGQILTYARLFDHDREIARQRIRNQPDLKPGDVGRAVSQCHLADANTDVTLKPQLDSFDLRIPVGGLPAEARTALARICKYHCMRLEYLESGQFFNLTEKTPVDLTCQPTVINTGQTHRELRDALAKRSQETIQSAAEADILRRMGISDINAQVFKEVSLTGHRDDDSGGIRADAVILPDDPGPLHAIELKQGGSSRAYYKGLGQALGAAALCELEFDVRTTPVLALDSLPVVGAALAADLPSGVPWENIWPDVYCDRNSRT